MSAHISLFSLISMFILSLSLRAPCPRLLAARRDGAWLLPGGGPPSSSYLSQPHDDRAAPCLPSGSSDGAVAELRRELGGAGAELGGMGEGSWQEGREATAEGKEIGGRGRGHCAGGSDRMAGRDRAAGGGDGRPWARVRH